jgi:hypothetical protein
MSQKKRHIVICSFVNRLLNSEYSRSHVLRCFDPAMGHHQGDGNSLLHLRTTHSLHHLNRPAWTMVTGLTVRVGTD